MESITHATVSTSENQKKGLPLHVLHVYQDSVVNHVDDYRPEGISVRSASVTQVFHENLINCKQIDAVIIGTDCRLSDIINIREITTKKFVPLILQSSKFEWKAKEFALEAGVDEYHIGLLDERLIKRIKLIRRAKFTTANKGLSDGGPVIRFWLLKRLLDILLSVLITVVLCPILLIILPVLMLNTKGAILSSSKRVGMNYKSFDLFKFNYGSSKNEKASGIWKFLQRMHLIRLPEMINVIKGDMSFIGNYPVSIQDAEMLTKDGMAWRFLVPAGIIGLWRFKDDEWDYMAADIEYAKTNSIWVDFWILVMHFLNLLQIKKDEGMSQDAYFENRALHATSN